MQVLNVLHSAHWKYRTQKITKNSPSRHHCTTLPGYIFATKAPVDNRKKKLVKQQYLLHMSSQYGQLRPTSGWDLLASLGHPCKFQRVWRFGSVTARHSSTGRQPKFAMLNRGRHLYSAGRPWHWPTFLVSIIFTNQFPFSIWELIACIVSVVSVADSSFTVGWWDFVLWSLCYVTCCYRQSRWRLETVNENFHAYVLMMLYYIQCASSIAL